MNAPNFSRIWRPLLISAALSTIFLPCSVSAQVVSGSLTGGGTYWTGFNATATTVTGDPLTAYTDFTGSISSNKLGPVQTASFDGTAYGGSKSVTSDSPGDVTAESYNSTDGITYSKTSLANTSLYVDDNSNDGGAPTEGADPGFSLGSDSKFLEFDPGKNADYNRIALTFEPNVDSFGAYFTGTETGTETITFSDGTEQVIDLPPASEELEGHNTGVAFAGFTAPGKSIATVDIDEAPGGDCFGIDDISFTVVPEPSSLVVLFIGTALITLFVGFRKKRSISL
jgi:hypothetical protein